MMNINLFKNLEKWQVVGGAVVLAVAVYGLIPDSIKFMTRGAHNEDAAYAKEMIASSSASYFLKNTCGEDGTENDEKELQRAFQVYEQTTGQQHWYKEMPEEERCRKVFRMKPNATQ